MQTTTDTRTVAEIAAGSLAAVRVFEKHGIDYCCGGKRPLAEVCEEKGLNKAAVELELNDALATKAANERDWNSAPMTDLIDHIVATHHEYLRRELPNLSARVEKVHRVYSERKPGEFAGLPEVFEGMRAELEQHMRKEEMMLFPTIAAYDRAASSGSPLPSTPFGSVANPIHMMESEHASAGDALERIREITRDYDVPDYACVTYRATIAGLRELEQDLHVHIHLENNILFPRAVELETKSR